jgi:plasmid maintenance system antidote protein VapI
MTNNKIINTKAVCFDSYDKIHVGNIIKKRLKQDGRSVRWFAEQMNSDRSNMYKLLSRSHLSSDFVMRASKIIEHDFFKDVSDLLHS